MFMLYNSNYNASYNESYNKSHNVLVSLTQYKFVLVKN